MIDSDNVLLLRPAHAESGFSRFGNQAAYERYLTALAQSPHWNGEISKELASRLKGHPEVLTLSPTPRSLLQD